MLVREIFKRGPLADLFAIVLTEIKHLYPSAFQFSGPHDPHRHFDRPGKAIQRYRHAIDEIASET